MSLFGALLDQARLLAPVVLAFASIAAIFLWWPGAIVGLILLALVGWWSGRQTERIGSQHHY